TYSGSARGWIATGTPCSSANRPWPETWSAWVCVSSTRSIRTPSCSATVRYCSISNAGSTTTATCACVSPTRYEAQPRSSFTNCRNSSTDRDANTLGGRRWPEPEVEREEQCAEPEQRGGDRDAERGLAERA